MATVKNYTKIAGPRINSLLDDPVQYLKDYYQKGLGDDKKNVFAERLEGNTPGPLTFEDATTVFEQEFKSNLVEYRREMLKAKAKRKAAVFLMPMWFFIRPIPADEEQQTWVNRLDEGGDLNKLAEEAGFLVSAYIYHTGEKPNPVLMCALFVPNL
jgi:hypothetical protein